MTKIVTVALLLATFSSFGQGMGISFDSKEVVRMDLWIFGVEGDTKSSKMEHQKAIPEELRVALDKIK